MDRVREFARADERIRVLALWGSLARGDADEWSSVDYVVVVADDAVAEVLDELGAEESRYGRSLITVPMPQLSVDGGGSLRAIYLRAGVLLEVNWLVSPRSLGIPVGDTKPVFTREGWPESGRSFARLLAESPSRSPREPSHWDEVVSTIPAKVKEIARGRPEVVLVDGEPARDARAAYAALDQQISELPAPYAGVKFALYSQLGMARLLR